MKKAKIQVRFSDCDMMGHVNNAVYLSYFETARIHYFNNLLGQNWNWKKNGIILLKNTIEYKHPVFLNDDVEIEIKTKLIGNKSFTLVYSLSVKDLEKTVGESVLVCYDFEQNKTVAIPNLLKKALEKL